MNMHVTIHFAV